MQANKIRFFDWKVIVNKDNTIGKNVWKQNDFCIVDCQIHIFFYKNCRNAPDFIFIQTPSN